MGITSAKFRVVNKQQQLGFHHSIANAEVKGRLHVSQGSLCALYLWHDVQQLGSHTCLLVD